MRRAGRKWRRPTGRQRHVRDIVKVTRPPRWSRHALLMVTSGISREQVLDPDPRWRSPSRWWNSSAAPWGSPTAVFRRRCSAKVLKGHAAPDAAPGRDAAAGGTSAPSARIQERLPRPVTDQDLAPISMYPRVSSLRPGTCCYGMRGSADPGVSSTGWSPGGDQRRSRARQDPHRALRSPAASRMRTARARCSSS